MNETAWDGFASQDDEKATLVDEIAHIRSLLKNLERNPFKIQAMCFYVMVEDGSIIGGESHEQILTLEHGRLDAVESLVDFAKLHIAEAVALA